MAGRLISPLRTRDRTDRILWAAIPFAIWFFLAIEGVPLAAEETQDPKKNLPKGLIVGMLILLLFAALILVVGPGGAGSSTLMASGNPLIDALESETAFGGRTRVNGFINLVGLAGLIASFFSIIFAYSRQVFALSRAGYLPRILSLTGSRKTPWIALVVPGTLGFALSLTGEGDLLILMAVFGATISYILMTASHIVLRRREPDLAHPYRTPGGSAALSALAPGLTPEMVAAVSKIMRIQDLVLVARKCRVVTAFRNTIGLPGRMATRLQPNHPTDDPTGIAAVILDGLLYGNGDAMIGINPAGDNLASVTTLLRKLDEIIAHYRIPTQSCVLTHVTTQIQAIEQGAPLDLMFQSIAGTQAANASFGVTLDLLIEAREAALSLERGTVGNQVMYFETGQGSALSANAHHRVDQQTLEARAYGLARRLDPFLVNTVVGFIGPEYLFNGKQIIRAGLEDHFCGKLLFRRSLAQLP